MSNTDLMTYFMFAKTRQHVKFITELMLQIGTVAGITAPLLAIFGNGIIYRYSQGRRLCIDDLSNPKLIRYLGRDLFPTGPIYGTFVL